MSFIGMSIVGNVTRSDRKNQRPVEEFQPIVKAAIESEGVSEIRWTQYTPYFNDGEPCVFHAHGLRSVTVDGVHVDEYGYGDDHERVIGSRPYNWSAAGRIPAGPYVGPNEARYDALEVLNSALGGGEFEDVLLDLFGDHAEIRIVPGDAIHVEYYEHD